MLLNWPANSRNPFITQRYGLVRMYSGEVEVVPGRFTDDFITAATADLRCPKAMIEVTWANSAVDQNVVISSNSSINRIDRTGQLFNGETESAQKWAYIHSGLIADGSFHAMPALDSDPQMGLYGNSNFIGDGSGDFSPAPYLTVTHDARSYTAITVAGDSGYNEYPVDFTITFTHAGGPTSIIVTGNTELVYSSVFASINDVTAIKLEITKWSAPNTLVKITQFAGSLIELYKSDEIVELNILEETNSDTGVVPIGNVSSNELDVSLLNTDRRFSYGNTDSPYVTSLRSGRKIRVWLGFILPVGSTDATGDVEGYIVETVSGEKIGYMPYGIYWSKDWISSYKSQVTNTTAYDIAYLLSQRDFLRSDNYTGSVESVVDDVLNKAKADIPDLKWLVSADTGAVNWDDVAIEPKNYLEVLKDIAEATLSYTYVDRNGFLIVGSRLGVNTPVESWQEVGLDTYYSYESQPKLDELVNLIRVGYTKRSPTRRDIYSDSEVFTIGGGGVLIFNILWSKADIDISSVVISLNSLAGVSSILSSVINATGATITAGGDPGNTFNISATDVGTVSVYSADEIFSIPASGVLNFYMTWSNVPVDIDTVAVTLIDKVGTPLMTDLNAYAYGADIEVTGAAGEQFKISATGKTFDLEENTETTAEDTNSVSIYGVREFALTGNLLISTVDQARELAASLLSFYGGLRQDGAMQWPASTLLSVGDTLEVVEFKSGTVETKDFFLIKRQSIKFDGSMQGQTELRRG